MNEDLFWRVIETACRCDSRTSESWHPRLVTELSGLTSDQIVEWDRRFDRLVRDACTVELMAACYLMNAGAGDDGFYYFRCWLVGMGKQVYTRALKDPDTLVEVALPYSAGIDAEAEIYSVARIAWMQAAGQSDDADYPVEAERAELIGEDWDFDDHELMSEHLPRLSAFYAD